MRILHSSFYILEFRYKNQSFTCCHVGFNSKPIALYALSEREAKVRAKRPIDSNVTLVPSEAASNARRMMLGIATPMATAFKTRLIVD
jgi:hypothetical protein